MRTKMYTIKKQMYDVGCIYVVINTPLGVPLVLLEARIAPSKSLAHRKHILCHVGFHNAYPDVVLDFVQ